MNILRMAKMRHEIIEFAQRMELQLAKYDARKGSEWKGRMPSELEASLRKASRSLTEAHLIGNRRMMVDRCLDVACYCMMLAWHSEGRAEPDPRKHLSPRQRKAYDSIIDFIARERRAPSQAEILRATGWKHRGDLRDVLAGLARKGAIQWTKGKHRGIKIAC